MFYPYEPLSDFPPFSGLSIFSKEICIGSRWFMTNWAWDPSHWAKWSLSETSHDWPFDCFTQQLQFQHSGLQSLSDCAGQNPREESRDALVVGWDPEKLCSGADNPPFQNLSRIFSPWEKRYSHMAYTRPPMPYLASGAPHTPYLAVLPLFSLLGFQLPFISRYSLKELPVEGCQLSSVCRRKLLH